MGLLLSRVLYGERVGVRGGGLYSTGLPLTSTLSHAPEESGESGGLLDGLGSDRPAALCINLIGTRPRSGTVTTSPSSAARLRRFNIVGRPRSNRAPVCWSRQRRRDRFPGSNGLDDDVDPGQGAFDFTLHALNLALQECLQLLELGREPFEFRLSNLQSI